MQINHRVVVFDAADLDTESRFWAALLDGEVEAEDDWHMVLVDGSPVVGVQLAPDHRRPGWPGGEQQQIHLDLWVEDPVAAQQQVLALGARVLQPAAGATGGDDFAVYEDPAGHPFCLCWVIR